MQDHQPREVSQGIVHRDTRTAEQRFSDALFRPDNFRNAMLLILAFELLLPALWPVWILVVWSLGLCFADKKFIMPLRMPKDVGGIDRTDYIDKRVPSARLLGFAGKSRIIRKFAMAGGIFYCGFMRSPNRWEQGRELWLTRSDVTTHMILTGTTGGGKTEALTSTLYNALCWGSGASYADGKGQNTLPFSIWSLSRRLGREDDFLILNFLTGGVDPFERLVAIEEGRAAPLDNLPQSNTMNPFGDGSADFLLQLLTSLLDKASGDSAGWQTKAINMIYALLVALCYKRAKGEVDISLGTIRHYLALQNLVTLYIEGRDGKLPEAAALPIKSYFETGLPGFIPGLAHDPSQWDVEVYNQHAYLSGQFSRTLSMMMDTYGFIFGEKFPEVDMLDVLLNNRVLVVLIPSIEKSASEAAALGKLYVASTRLMMAQNLGFRVEGSKSDVIDTSATTSSHPSLVIKDEIAFYFAEGIAVEFAQARSLGFFMVAAAQDVQGMKRGEAGKESASLIANTKIKWSLALEDPEDTFDMIKKSAGQAYFSVLSGHSTAVGPFATSYEAQGTANLEKRDRVSLEELKRLNPGEGVIVFKDAVVRSSAFYIPQEDKQSAKLSARINRFIQIERPKMNRLPASAKRIEARDTRPVDRIFLQLSRGARPYYPTLDDPILDAVVDTARHLSAMTRIPVSEDQRGIALFEAARRAMHKARASGRTGTLHEGRFDDPDELLPEDIDDIPDSAYADE